MNADANGGGWFLDVEYVAPGYGPEEGDIDPGWVGPYASRELAEEAEAEWFSPLGVVEIRYFPKLDQHLWPIFSD